MFYRIFQGNHIITLLIMAALILALGTALVTYILTKKNSRKTKD